jgi:anti-sigma-K factor RskA
MQSHLDHPNCDQAADYVLNQLDDSELAQIEKALLSDAQFRLKVKELSDASAAIAYTADQALPPQQVHPTNKVPKVESIPEAGANSAK